MCVLTDIYAFGNAACALAADFICEISVLPRAKLVQRIIEFCFHDTKKS
jgi:hypothetical protein